ncbi:hypothetical protein MML48_2g00007876 [Holotrichia oblita]|uniref:Uncharacterized protein n=1 Tax=Holotrichia oblita TaxID=644536 RepID=A0ACB9TP37_HOLOL|nr:hypothetical protein MML48_2g00007876 [Holotrichia oblita]
MASKRNYLTLKEKIEIVEVYKSEKLSNRELAKRFGIGKTQTANIIKNRDDLLKALHANVNVNKKQCFINKGGADVDRMCYEWFIKARSKGIPLSGLIVQSKAKEIAESIDYTGFNASYG